MTARPSTSLKRLRELRSSFAEDTGEQKLELLRALARARLDNASGVLALHEALCFLRAYPDNQAILEQVETMLVGFGQRADLRRHRRELEGTGIAGTAIPYRFYFTTARWLGSRWPTRLAFEWREHTTQDRLKAALAALVSPAEANAIRERRTPVRKLVEEMCGSTEADGACIVRHIGELDADDAVREALHDGIDSAYRLRPGDRPSRTLAHYDVGEVEFQTAPLSRKRPDLRKSLARPPRAVRYVEGAEGETLIDLAREAMVTRARDLDAFAYGNPDDVSITNDADGLAFVCIGSKHERRHLIRAAHGMLVLKNGVPVGYVQLDTALGRTEVSFNIFETFRGAEAATLFARTLAVAHHLLHATSFSIEPYQLGHKNREALDSGAWWFYYKFGFRPRQKALLALASEELEQMKADPSHRSSRTTLKVLARQHVFFDLDRRRRPEPPPFLGVSRAVSAMIRERFDGDRKRAAKKCTAEALAKLQVRSFSAKTKGQRLAIARLSPVIVCLDGVERWKAAERRAVVPVVLAKGSAREHEFLERLAAHPRLGPALLELGTKHTPETTRD